MEYLRENNDFVTEKDGLQKNKYCLYPPLRKESPAFLSSCPHSLHPL